MAASPPPGPATDARGLPVVDPSPNVLDLVEGSVKRLDDLRHVENKATRRAVNKESKHIREVVKMRSEIAELRAEHTKDLQHAEAGRIDAILLNIRDTAEITAAAAETRATTLANQVTTSADALRNQVADAAQVSNDNLDRRFGPIQASIEEIRKFQFETQGGKAGASEQTQDRRQSSGLIWTVVGVFVAIFVGFNGLLLTALGIGVTYMLTR